MNNQKKISCPTCGKQTIWSPDNTFRPFCSDRCKLIDLGEWASETRKIPGEYVTDPSSSGNNNPDELFLSDDAAN
jgi:endogenous inhibitor of DNA gyrase (YacG/DUF329 family)